MKKILESIKNMHHLAVVALLGCSLLFIGLVAEMTQTIPEMLQLAGGFTIIMSGLFAMGTD